MDQLVERLVASVVGAVVGALVTAGLGLLLYVYRDRIKHWLDTRRPVRADTEPLTSLLGIEPGVRRLLAAEQQSSGTEYFAVGECIELARAPNLREGWIPGNMTFTVSTVPFPLPYGLEKLCDEWKRKQPNDADKLRYSLIGISGQNTTDAPFIGFAFRKTTFGRVFPFKSSLDKSIEIQPGDRGIPRHRFGQHLLSLSESNIPNFLVFHLVIKTADGYIAFAQRAKGADVLPLRWSASCEEQLAQEDFQSNNPFISGSRRALKEEFGVSVDERQIRIKVLSVFLEYGRLNTGCCVVAELPHSSRELKRSWIEKAQDRREAEQVRFVSSSFEVLTKILESGSAFVNGEQIVEDFWHPTTKYRLFMYCASAYGFTQVHGAIAEARERNRITPRTSSG